MANMKLERQKMPIQSPEERIKNFDEVNLGYTQELAMAEASRCLNCKHKPCVTGCPVHNNIPGFMAEVVKGDFKRAYEIISETSSLPAICSRVCSQESQCEGSCVRGIKGEPVAIGPVERFVADWYFENCEIEEVTVEKNGHKVAVVGSGPAGLACATDLAKMGFDVTIFESLHEAGGVMLYGIPEFRLTNQAVRNEVIKVKKLGVKIETNVIVGRTVMIPELIDEGFEAFFIGTGTPVPKFMGIKGENYIGVMSANEYLTRINLMKAYNPKSETSVVRGKHICVIGGGNVAMDAASCAVRMGAETVQIVYRRSMEELPARSDEVHYTMEEGVLFETLTNPLEILADERGFVTGMRCVKMELGEPDSSGRRRPVEVEGSEFIMKTDSVIMALGTSPNNTIVRNYPELEIDRWGCVVVNEKGQTSVENVFSGGDVVTGALTVVSAMKGGKLAAKSISELLLG